MKSDEEIGAMISAHRKLLKFERIVYNSFTWYIVFSFLYLLFINKHQTVSLFRNMFFISIIIFSTHSFVRTMLDNLTAEITHLLEMKGRIKIDESKND